MNCTKFLELYSDFRDGELESDQTALVRSHLESCSECARYHEVVDRGAELLRSVGGPAPRGDFDDRLRHRIYQADLEASRRPRGYQASGPLTVAFTATAVLVGVAVWGPLVQGSMSPEAAQPLPGITAAAPPAESLSAGAMSEASFAGNRLLPSPDLRPASASTSSAGPAFLTDSDLWGGANVLLWEYSSLYHRSRSGRLIQTGLH